MTKIITGEWDGEIISRDKTSEDRYYDKLNLELDNIDGNAFALLAYVKREAKKKGWSDDRIKALINEAMAEDYDHLIATILNA